MFFPYFRVCRGKWGFRVLKVRRETWGIPERKEREENQPMFHQLLKDRKENQDKTDILENRVDQDNQDIRVLRETGDWTE